MLFELLRSGFSRDMLIQFLLFIPVMLISLPIHELAHGYAAHKMGDHTARNFGRLTLNPLKHLDPLGTLSMLLLGIGWAKPVPINARNFDKPGKGMALTALAGPMSNLALCFVSVLVYMLSLRFLPESFVSQNYTLVLAWITFWSFMAYYNAVLCIFNLIPVPPLDGSRILGLLLPARWYWKFMQYERYIMIGFLAIWYLLSRMGINLLGVPADLLVQAFQIPLEWIFF